MPKERHSSMTKPAPHRTIPTRRISFEESLRELPRHFAGSGDQGYSAGSGDLISSHVVAALSAVFPEGEEYFVRSVRHYRDQVTDPALKRQIAGFIGQESMHGRAHRAFNNRLAELGYPTTLVDRIVRRALKLRERLLSPISNLGTTAALEHFTATLAAMVLTDEEVRNSIGHQGVRDLFTWHALEESEHKAVAFDVFRTVGGTERTRRWTMNAITAVFLIGMAFQIGLSLLLDRDTYRRGVLLQSWRTFRQSSLVRRDVWKKLRAYNRPGFHPDDFDTSELEETWRTQLFGEAGTLNDKLVTAVD